MRVIAAAMLYLYIVVLAICSVGIQGIDYPSVSFNLAGAKSATYRDFLKNLRTIVATGTYEVNGLPVLRRESEVQVKNRFVLVLLTNYNGNTVTLAVDVTNLYVVAFSANANSYFFKDATQLQKSNLFVGTRQHTLPFTGNYDNLETAAGTRRESIELGPSPLDGAITSLYYDESVARSLLVVIQMVSEAARFRYIEQEVRRSLQQTAGFTPNALMLSMENNWSSMSLEVQQSGDNVSPFTGTVQLQNYDHTPRLVDNFEELYKITGIAILLFRCFSPSNDSAIRRPHVLAGEDNKYNDGETCPIPASFTRRIVGRDGLCVDVRDGYDTDGTPIQLWPCGSQRNQQWTFHKDDTIRSMGKCMTANGFNSGSSIMIFNCSTAVKNATKWEVPIDGSIINPSSGRVMTAPSAASRTILLLQNNIYAASQGWTVSNDVQPVVASIVGYKEMCLQANGENNGVWMENCEVTSLQQQWALFGDRTIRVNSDRGLCVTTNGYHSKDLIIILKCQGLPSQRWFFNSNGAIVNPNSTLVMDVKANDVSLREIIIFPSHGDPNQQWVTQVLPS
uniref:Ribosome-inactivating protein n=1 Tax=Sambucus nigra TaxID=4202 RepID=O04367_SAMNI|nr:ribosome inactivating protein precursor [Sambucus nigra]